MIKRLIVIGGSAGSLHALFRVIGAIREDFPFPILLVLHRHNTSDSMLEELLASKSVLPAREIEEKDKIEPGYIYTCPPDYHVLIESDETFSLDDSEKINFSRPSIDVVFRSATDVFGKRIVGILLSGANADGAEGLYYIKENGGITIVQDPSDAQVSYMPEQALKLTKPSHVLDADAIGKYLNEIRD